MVRRYRLGRRAEAAEETRRRIVDATFALHAEQGIAATTMKQIAERADVSVGTVYHHFPTYEDAIRACGQYTLTLAPLPDEAIFAGARSRMERVERLVAALFERYERLPNYDGVRCDRRKFAPLGEFFAAEEAQKRRLAGAALGGPNHAAAPVPTIVALFDYSVFRSLREAGLSASSAAVQIAGVINAWLDSHEARPA